jgi:hypothetical protein
MDAGTAAASPEQLSLDLMLLLVRGARSTIMPM